MKKCLINKKKKKTLGLCINPLFEILLEVQISGRFTAQKMKF